MRKDEFSFTSSVTSFNVLHVLTFTEINCLIFEPFQGCVLAVLGGPWLANVAFGQNVHLSKLNKIMSICTDYLLPCSFPYNVVLNEFRSTIVTTVWKG